MSYPSPTTGVGVAANIKVPGNQNSGNTTPGYNDVVISLSGAGGFPESFQLSPEVVDAAGTPVGSGTQFVLTAAASSSGNTAVYTGTITGGGTNAFAGKTFVVAGFVATPANNGTFIATASSATTLTLENASAVAETHAATATTQETTNSLVYSADGSSSSTSGTVNPGDHTTIFKVVSVSATGLITTNGVTGGSVVQVAYPTFNGSNAVTVDKVYAEVNVTVVQ